MEILTGCYAHYRPEHGQAVRISLGKPRWFPNGGEDLPFVKVLAPAGWYFNEPDEEVFERRYRHQLHKTTPQRVLEMLQAVAAEHDAERLILCCFEGNPENCHRGMFARWWLQKTGEWVPDLAEMIGAQRG